MASFYFYSDAGDSLFLAMRLMREGHRVKFYVDDSQSRDVGRGLISRVSSFRPERADILVFDMVKHGAIADGFRRRGFRVLGAGRFADVIELDRMAGHKIMQSVGIAIPETYEFSKRQFKDARLLVSKSQKDEWFYKPSGNIDAGFTFGSKSRDEMLRMLDWYEREPPDKFIMQKKIKGTEISLEGWFDGTRFVYPFNSTVEDKKFLVGDLGPATGCMANLVWAYDDPQPLIVLKTLWRLIPILLQVNYVGPIDLNMIIDSEGVPYGLEWSARFGYDAIQALSMLVTGDFGKQLEDFANGKLDSFSIHRDLYGLTIRVSVPPFPNFQFADSVKGLPLDPAILVDPNRIFLGDVMLEKGKPVVAGSDAGVCVVGETGTDIGILRNQVLDRIRSLKIPNAQYRTDPVNRAESVLNDLRKYGYLPALSPSETTTWEAPPLMDAVVRGPTGAGKGSSYRATDLVTSGAKASRASTPYVEDVT